MKNSVNSEEPCKMCKASWINKNMHINSSIIGLYIFSLCLKPSGDAKFPWVKSLVSQPGSVKQILENHTAFYFSYDP